MEENATPLLNTCNSRDVEPIMMSLPYPEVKVREKNLAYANLLSIDYCGSVSEMSAIMQFILRTVSVGKDNLRYSHGRNGSFEEIR